MVVDEVIGYAQAPCVIWVSTQTTALAPSAVVGMPGNSGFSRSSRDCCSVSMGTPLITVLILALQKNGGLLGDYPAHALAIAAAQIYLLRLHSSRFSTATQWRHRPSV